MFRVLTCLTVEHDWRLVGVAAVLCLFASLTAVNLFNRARATAGRARALWIIAAATATGFGIWATHFVAMLAYEPGIPIAYSLSLTVLSLAAAALITGSGLGIAVYSGASWAPAFAGAVVGGGIAAMHYTGMFAVEIPGRVTWDFRSFSHRSFSAWPSARLRWSLPSARIAGVTPRWPPFCLRSQSCRIISRPWAQWRLCPIPRDRLTR
jgi:NO-binding membrane sensor protein with MHYT domain